MISPEHELSLHVWRSRYRNQNAPAPERSLEATWERVAHAVASAERDSKYWSERFLRVMQDFRFLPGGRILAGAGLHRPVTLANCFVMGPLEDSVAGIFESLKEGALTIEQGGGVGYDFSNLRPRGSAAVTTGTVSSGPVSFMHVWDAMCGTLLSNSPREGAMMASLRCDHPDVEAFIEAKRDPSALKHFNLSVQVTDAFMQAVISDAEWPLVFPSNTGTLERVWTAGIPVRCATHATVRARTLWKKLCETARECAEPGVLFVDKINAENNLAGFERITTTNPCAEAPLPPYGACHLGSINLSAFVLNPFSASARLSESALEEVAQTAARFLDDVIDISSYPLLQQRETARRTRRIALGITGLADALAMLGLRYDSEAARATAVRVMRLIRDAAYSASVELAAERGAFPAFDAKTYCAAPFIQRLPKPIQDSIARVGVRNSHLLAIAPAGAISLLAENVSSGIEPMFGLETFRRVRGADGTYRNFEVTDHAYALWRGMHAGDTPIPDYFVDAAAIAPRDQLLMQAALTPLVDGSISKTISLPRGFDPAGVPEIFETAYLLGLKGCTVFSSETRAASIARKFDAAAPDTASEYCCTIGRSTD